MIPKDTIEILINEYLLDTDLFLVDIKIAPGNVITVFVDSDTAVPIDKCAALSKAIEAGLDREAEDFELSVSSAGLDMPLKLPRQYRKHAGRDLDILAADGTKYLAKLISASDTCIEIAYQEKIMLEGKKRKQLVDKVTELKYSDIKTTFINISFK
jgi:ribosome maturation factor RimP